MQQLTNIGVVQRSRNYYVFFSFFFLNQVYCARGTVLKLHIDATSKEEGGGEAGP